MLEQDLYKLQTAIQLFPYDFRFRIGLIQVTDRLLSNEIAIPILENMQKLEPKSVSLTAILIRRYKQAGDNVNASKQLKLFLELKNT
jgi:hypothetical protein